MKRFRIFLASLGRRTFSFPFLTPPMGILMLAAHIRKQFPGAVIKLYDQRALNASVDDVVLAANDFEPDVVGFSSMTSFGHILRPLTAALREVRPKALIAIGGPHASAFQAQALEECGADIAVVGEGELTFERVLEAYLSGGGFDAIPGLAWRDPSGDVRQNPGQMPLIMDMDSLPFPAYDLLNMQPYWTLPPMSALPVRRYVSFFTSRGCPYHCIYCHNVFGKRFRPQSAQRMAEEVEHFVRLFNVREIEFLDDMVNCDAQRILDFCDLAAKKDLKLRINLPNSLRTDILTEEVIDALVDTGLYHSSFALESGSPRIQNLMRKNLNIPKFLENVELATRKGVFANGFTMLGFPTETEEEIKSTIDVACNSTFHTATFFTVIPYPHTALYELAKQTHPDRLELISYTDSDYHNIKVNFSEVPDDVFFAHQRWAWRRFFLQPRRLIRIIRDYPQRQY
ncbi:MAG TPA: B12-binding domain-containing radical SAM protein, partial [Candidatus Hydrogenedentes bacterium]|nr:B12-binding domain-containing radical SAM protein [Candidatus Hydrogenedentota bacterium]